MKNGLAYDPENPPFEPHWEVTEDLHLHTTASDGLLTPTALVEYLGQTSLKLAAITDHDTVAGIDEALKAGANFPNLHLIPGIEMSARTEKADMHIVGLFINHRDTKLNATLERFQAEREGAVKKVVAKLATMGMKVEYERVRELAGGTIGRPHIARAMLEKGYISSFKEAFDKYLGDGKPANVGRKGVTPSEALKIIHSVGGVGVLAHPRTVANLEDELPLMVESGLVGIEVYAEKYRGTHHGLYQELADKYGLEISGGSDYHANGNETEVKPGQSGPPDGTTAKLYQRALALHGDKIGYKMGSSALGL